MIKAIYVCVYIRVFSASYYGMFVLFLQQETWLFASFLCETNIGVVFYIYFLILTPGSLNFVTKQSAGTPSSMLCKSFKYLPQFKFFSNLNYRAYFSCCEILYFPHNLNHVKAGTLSTGCVLFYCTSGGLVNLRKE